MFDDVFREKDDGTVVVIVMANPVLQIVQCSAWTRTPKRSQSE
jgi:hypothetical protein